MINKRKCLLRSAIIAFVLLIFTYFLGNLPYSIMGEKLFLKKAVALHEIIKKEKGNKDVLDDVLFVNVAYDKEMRPYCDTLMGWCGSIPVTNRHKLLELLKYLKKQEEIEQESGGNYYKFILLDVSFGSVKTEWDPELFSLIKSMPRIVVPYREDEKIVDEGLMEKARLAKYLQFIQVAGFTKYPYFIKTNDKRWEKTIPAEMFEKTTGRKIKKLGPFYFDGWRMAKRSCFLSLDVWPDYWYNLGMDLLNDTLTMVVSGTDTTLLVGENRLYNSSKLTKNKYIIIGSHYRYGDDMHNTFKGDMAGAALCYNAFHSMIHNQYLVNPFIVLFLFFMYFILAIIVLGDGKERIISSKWFKKLRKRWKLVVFLSISFLGTFIVLKVSSLLIFVVFGKIIEIFIVSIVFSIMSLIVKFNKIIQS